MILRHLCVCDRERIFASFVLLLKGSLKPSSDYRIGRLYLGKESKFCFFQIFSKTIIEAFRPGHSISRGWPSKCRYIIVKKVSTARTAIMERIVHAKPVLKTVHFTCWQSIYSWTVNGEGGLPVHFTCRTLCTLTAWTEYILMNSEWRKGSTSALYLLHIMYTMNSEWRKGLPVHFTCCILCTLCAQALSRVVYRYTTLWANKRDLAIIQ